MKKPKFIKEIEKSEGKERAKCGRWYIRVYGELDHKPMVELESLEIVVKELHKLEEENKNLKEYNGELIENHKKDIAILCEENKKLNIKVASLEGEIKGLNYTIDKLKEENQTLELWLDNKEKLNEEYRKQIDLWKMSREEKDENCYGLAKENEHLKKEIEELKSDLEECECSFGFESDEVGFWKREYKRLKKWIKDHCKGYGNLFPEDEMKRQWKKADKKRK